MFTAAYAVCASMWEASMIDTLPTAIELRRRHVGPVSPPSAVM